MTEISLISDTEESFTERIKESLKENYSPVYETFKITLLSGNKDEGEDQIVLYSILMKKG